MPLNAYIIVLLAISSCYTGAQRNEGAIGGRLYVSNLNASCLRCLCYGSTSCRSPGCENDYCGPFYISKAYWSDAEKYVLKQDDKNRIKAWEDCALDYSCATEIVARYMKKYGRDCNENGVTDCDDFAAIHYNGGYSCDRSIQSTEFGQRYRRCKIGQAAGIPGIHGR